MDERFQPKCYFVVSFCSPFDSMVSGKALRQFSFRIFMKASRSRSTYKETGNIVDPVLEK